MFVSNKLVVFVGPHLFKNKCILLYVRGKFFHTKNRSKSSEKGQLYAKIGICFSINIAHVNIYQYIKTNYKIINLLSKKQMYYVRNHFVFLCFIYKHCSSTTKQIKNVFKRSGFFQRYDLIRYFCILNISESSEIQM